MTRHPWLLLLLLPLAPGCSDDAAAAPDAAVADAATTADATPDTSPPDASRPRGWIKVTTKTTPPGRGVHLMAYDPDTQRVLLVAGQPNSSTVPVGDIWAYDGKDWTELKPSGATLPPRKNFGLAYDTARKRLVVFGGIHGGLSVTPTYLADTWEWDGTGWTELKPTQSPPARAGHGMAYDAARKRVVVCGGAADSSSPLIDDTWEWDGQAWYAISSAKTPGSRFNTRMVHDRDAKRVLLFGGQTETGGNLGDLWSFDGTTWTELWPDGKAPLGRGFFGLARDPARGRLVLYGGSVKWPPYIASDNIFADQWEWDGKAWTKVGDGKGPGKSSGAALAFDEGRGRLVLFGGSRDGFFLHAETWEYY